MLVRATSISRHAKAAALAGAGLVAAGLAMQADPLFGATTEAVKISEAWVPPAQQAGGDLPLLMTIKNEADIADTLLRVRCPVANFAEKPWSRRLAKPVNSNIVRVERDFDDPLPPEAKGLDVVVDNLFYHDTVWLKIERGRMNLAVFAALKPGGVYCVIDHSGRAGTGSAEASTLHRIDESVVKDEVQRAGFKLVAESQAWTPMESPCTLPGGLPATSSRGVRPWSRRIN